jgi:glucosamine-6-phosphate deaminase
MFMKIKLCKTPSDIYNHILDNNLLEGKNIILPTGKTPLGLYKEIVKRKIDFSDCVTFNLDEYYPCEKTNPDSYYYYMWENLFQYININTPIPIPIENINLFDGGTKDVVKECYNYSNKLKENPIDIVFLGIGENGHIAFNEPFDINIYKTRCTYLTRETKEINKCKYDQALTLGLNDIFSGKKIIVMAIGINKSNIIYDLINMYWIKSVDELLLPASYLFLHNNVDFYIDINAFDKILNVLNKVFQSFKKVLIMSPHPDDDVIGMGATIKKMRDLNMDVSVMFQTSGAGGGNILVRQNEAIEALRIVGVEDIDKIIFCNTPFYKNKNIIKNIIKNNDNDDIIYTMEKITQINPDIIFFAGDTCDPNKTHLKCYEIIQSCLKQEENKKIVAYNYYSAWSEPASYDIKEYFNSDVMEIKKNSIKAHASQLNPTFKGSLDDEFYRVIEKRNRKDGENICIYDNNIYSEGFTRYI